MPNLYEPTPEHKFTFGLWTVGITGRVPFGAHVRAALLPVKLVYLLHEVSAYGVNFYDNDLIPIDASPAEATSIKKDFRYALDDTGLVVPMATINLFSDPIFKDGAFTSKDPKVRLYALQKAMQAIDIVVEFGARFYVFWGGHEGTEPDSSKDPLEAKPNEPRTGIYNPTTGHMHAFINTLARPEKVGVNPDVANEHMAGLNFIYDMAQAWEAGKLFHIDLNDQYPGRYNQDLRFGSRDLKSAFFLVKFLEGIGYSRSRHFDAHAYRTEDYQGVKDFARGCMRTYLVIKEKAERSSADPEIQALLAVIQGDDDAFPEFTDIFSSKKAVELKARELDRSAITLRGLNYEHFDQLTIDLILGER